ncbi:MAG: hypothetical protein HQM09_15040 [Candidatus Riflebacteria bacterium]|nr:hypothetical protein [Candidatus Riflebacteria bacterium]
MREMLTGLLVSTLGLHNSVDQTLDHGLSRKECSDILEAFRVAMSGMHIVLASVTKLASIPESNKQYLPTSFMDMHEKIAEKFEQPLTPAAVKSLKEDIKAAREHFAIWASDDSEESSRRDVLAEVARIDEIASTVNESEPVVAAQKAAIKKAVVGTTYKNKISRSARKTAKRATKR